MTLTDLQRHSISAVRKLQSFLRKKSVDAFFVADMANVRYLTTFSGTSGSCLVFPDSSYFLTDFRYKVQAAEQVRSCEVIIYAGDVFEFMKKKFFGRNGSRRTRVALENTIPVGLYDKVVSLLSGCEISKADEVVEKLAAVKSKAEVERIRKACWISASALDIILQEDWVGKTEIEISSTIEFNQKILGASKESFDTIVASGGRGARRQFLQQRVDHRPGYRAVFVDVAMQSSSQGLVLSC